jgi:hypothetical protein
MAAIRGHEPASRIETLDEDSAMLYYGGVSDSKRRKGE